VAGRAGLGALLAVAAAQAAAQAAAEVEACSVAAIGVVEV